MDTQPARIDPGANLWRSRKSRSRKREEDLSSSLSKSSDWRQFRIKKVSIGWNMRRKRKRERNGETKRDGNRERGQKTSSEPKREREGEERRKKENSKKSEVTPRGKLGSLPLLSLPVFFGHSGHRTLTYAHATLSHARIGTHVHASSLLSLLPFFSFSLCPFYIPTINTYVSRCIHAS